VEAGIFAWELYGELVERAQQEARTHERTFLETMVSEPEILDERKHREALQQAKELDAKREAETNALRRTFQRDADKTNAFSKLSRYETAIERSLYRALHELQRLQAALHANGKVTPPVAVDVEVSGQPREESRTWVCFVKRPDLGCQLPQTHELNVETVTERRVVGRGAIAACPVLPFKRTQPRCRSV
jgi:hypothetical protein